MCVFIHPFTALLKISVVATRSRNIKNKTQQRVVLSNAECSQCHRPPHHFQTEQKTKRDAGVLSCSVGGGGEVGEKQAGRWSESSPGGGENSLSTSHLQLKVVMVMVMVQEVSPERTQLRNNMGLKRETKKAEERPG